MQVVRVIDAVD